MSCGANERVSSELGAHLTATKACIAAGAFPTEIRLIDGT